VSAVVLVYHAVGAAPRTEPLHNSFVPVDLFEAQMTRLARAGTVVPLDRWLDGAGGRRVAITFDDGYRSVLTHALPVLEGLGLPATVFVPTAHVGDRNRWDPPTPLPLDVMTADELAEVARRGLELGSHGHAHCDLSAVSAEEAAADIATSATRLEALTGRRPRFLAYPFGRSSAAARAAARDCGFEAAFAMEAGGADAGDRFAVPRTPVYPFDRRVLFDLKASGRYRRWRHSPAVAAAYDRVRPLVRGRRLWP
jgi:peptidoglycan/xylan/chitin deacetylase (PgdA/CDA1 family)